MLHAHKESERTCGYEKNSVTRIAILLTDAIWLNNNEPTKQRREGTEIYIQNTMETHGKGITELKVTDPEHK